VARITATIRPVHTDGSACTHKVTSRGVPKDPRSGCTGRTGFAASCSACTWTGSSSTGTALEYERDRHLRDHAADRVCDFCGQVKPDVTRREDPFCDQASIPPHVAPICDDCHDERFLDG
jgi:hypothetical protein